MARSKVQRIPSEICQACGELLPCYEMTILTPNEGPSETLCSACCNTRYAAELGLTGFEHVRFQPMRLKSADGRVHEFHFHTHLGGTHVGLRAFELDEQGPAGYCFQIAGDPEADLMALFGQLVEKMRRGLARRHIVRGRGSVSLADEGVARGWIRYDHEEEGRVPQVVIDGRPYSWDEFGRLLMTYEGWQFKIEMRDPYDEV